MATQTGQRVVGRVMGQVLLAGEEPDEGTPRATIMITDGPAQHRVAGFQGVQHRPLSHRARDIEVHLPIDAGEGPQVRGEHDPDHGSVWTSTDSTAGRSRTIGAQLSPESAEA